LYFKILYERKRGREREREREREIERDTHAHTHTHRYEGNETNGDTKRKSISKHKSDSQVRKKQTSRKMRLNEK
jgi:hypothetical protein